MANTLKLGAGKWATGNGTVLAFNDENNNFKPLPFNFTRASKATVVNQSGFIEEVGTGDPRIDFQGNTKGALLLEPQRTNYVPNSENMSAWNRTSLLSVTGGNVGVYGSVNAYNVIPNETSTSHRIWISSLGLSSNNHTFTIYAKENGCKDLFVYCNSTGTDYARWFNLETGVMGTASGGPTSTSMTPVGNGWHKIQISGNTDLVSIEVYLGNGTESISWLPDGTQGVLMQFGQLEVGSYATSYIPTSGSAVTRVQDACSQTLPNEVFNSYPFSVFTEVDVIDTSAGYAFSLLKSTSSAEYFTIEYFSNVWHITSRPNGSTERITSTVTVTEGTHKLVGVWESSSMKLYLNGSLIASGSNSQSFNIQVNSMILGQLRISGDVGSRNPIRQALLYNTALTDSEAIALTS